MDKNVTEMLAAYHEGEEGAFEKLVELIYDDLRRIAHRVGAGPHATMNTTALVNEAYLKIAGSSQLGWNDRNHLLAFAARAMRHILVDYVRHQSREKRGGGAKRVSMKEADLRIEEEMDKLLAVDTALQDLARENPRMVRVVECRYFAGMTEEETAAALDISLSTVQREWRRAKIELKRRIEG